MRIVDHSANEFLKMLIKMFQSNNSLPKMNSRQRKGLQISSKLFLNTKKEDSKELMR
mgnify:CR=1 FL=1